MSYAITKSHMLLVLDEGPYFEVDKHGNVVLTKKKIDLSKITAEELKALGIDPTLSAKEIAKKLKVNQLSCIHCS